MFSKHQALHLGPRLVHSWWLNPAGVAPDDLALLSDRERWTYKELAERATICARRLAARGVRLRDRVLVRLPVTPTSVAVLCGCSMLGATFVIINPEEPGPRAQAIREAVEPQIEIDAKLAVELVRAPQPGEDLGLPELGSGPLESDLAYILFTSGSTGVPKGIAMPHASAVAVFRNAASFCNLSSGDRLLTTAPLQFDFSLLDFGIALGAGAALVMAPRLLLFQPAQLFKFAEEMQVTQIDVVPSVWRILTQGGRDESRVLSQLHTVVFGGEGFTRVMVDDARRLYPKLRVVNAYGPSECIACCFSDVPNESAQPPSLGWGHPEAEVFLIGSDGLQVTTVGAIGEIVVAGPTLFRGYWQDRSATEGALRPHPLREKQSEVAYFTGDLGRVGEDGDLYFAGRRDQQVKINGNRVEVEEIERVLASHSGISMAGVVAVAEDDRNRLVALVTLKDQATASGSDLREWCGSRLPRYMVPSDFVVLDSLPLLPAGKLDRAQLRRLAGR